MAPLATKRERAGRYNGGRSGVNDRVQPADGPPGGDEAGAEIAQVAPRPKGWRQITYCFTPLSFSTLLSHRRPVLVWIPSPRRTRHAHDPTSKLVAQLLIEPDPGPRPDLGQAKAQRQGSGSADDFRHYCDDLGAGPTLDRDGVC